jgi:hypothetical protein
VVIRRVGGNNACHVVTAKAVVESLCWKQTRTVMKYQLCLSLIDILSEFWIPNLDCIVWWRFVYDKIACLGEWFSIGFMTASFGGCLLFGQTYTWRFGGMTVSSCAENLQKNMAEVAMRWTCIRNVPLFPVLAKALIILIGFSWFSSDDQDKCRHCSSH